MQFADCDPQRRDASRVMCDGAVTLAALVRPWIRHVLDFDAN